MFRLVRDLQLVDTRGCKYLAADERRGFLKAAARAPRPAGQTFALTLVYTGARVSEALAIYRRDVDLEAGSLWIRKPLKQPRRALALRSRATADRKITRIMTDAGIERAPKPARRGLRHGCCPGRPRQPADHLGLRHLLRASRRGSFWPGCGKRRGIQVDPGSEGLPERARSSHGVGYGTERCSPMRVTRPPGVSRRVFLGISRVAN